MNDSNETTNGTTAQTLERHLSAFQNGDVDALMADYSEDSVFCTPDGILRGKSEIRPMYEQLLRVMPPGSQMVLQQRIIDGDFAYVVWTGESDAVQIPFATDTLFVQDGLIERQTFAAAFSPKRALDIPTE